MIESVSAITLATHDMGRAVRFYRALGFDVISGDADATFTSFRAGTGYLNLTAQPADRQWSWWGRAVFHVADVDAVYRRAVAEGLDPQSPPPRRRMGRALLPHHGPGRPRTQLRPACGCRKGEVITGVRRHPPDPARLPYYGCDTKTVLTKGRGSVHR